MYIRNIEFVIEYYSLFIYVEAKYPKTLTFIFSPSRRVHFYFPVAVFYEDVYPAFKVLGPKQLYIKLLQLC